MEERPGERLAFSVRASLSAEGLQEDASRERDTRREKERERENGGGGGSLLFASHSAINQLEDSQLARRPPSRRHLHERQAASSLGVNQCR